MALLIDGYREAVLIDARTYPARGVEEPEKDKVLRGSKDGFVETVVFNTALIRDQRDIGLFLQHNEGKTLRYPLWVVHQQ